MIDIKNIAAKLVDDGASVLDTIVGLNWIDLMPVDETEINFMDSVRCPLHYAFGGFLKGDRMLEIKGIRNIGAYGFAHPMEFNGLNVDQMLEAYAAVDAAWHTKIRTLRQQS